MTLLQFHEYESKLHFARFGIPIPRGRVADNPDDAYLITQELGCYVVVKAQVTTKKRLQDGGILFANNADEARTHAATLLNTTIAGFIVDKVLIEPVVDIQQEFYLAITYDSNISQPVLIAADSPDMYIREPIAPFLGIRAHQIISVANDLNIPREHWHTFTTITRNLYRCFTSSDAILTEIDSLVLTEQDYLVALDCRMNIDPNAAFRQQDLISSRDTKSLTEAELLAEAADMNYVEMPGHIGCIANGAGLAMAIMDMLIENNITGPANFLDIQDSPDTETLVTAFRIVLSHKKLTAIFLNLFEPALSCQVIADNIIQAYNIIQPPVPVVIRLKGPELQLGRQKLRLSGLSNLHCISNLKEGMEVIKRADSGQ